MMLTAKLMQLPLGLLLASLVAARPGRLSKRDPNYDVLGGANYPDPSIWIENGVAYTFATVDGAGRNVPMSSNPDFSNAAGWSAITEAFPQDDVPAVGSGGWAAPYTTWAPDVQQLTDYDNSYAMYYSAALQSNGGIHCVGLARSTSITGPYNDSSTAPLICPESDGGAIDAAGFLDSDNSRYVVYKIDGPAVNNGGYCNNPSNPPSTNTSLMLQQVQSDGYTLIGSPVILYNNQGVSDSYNVEAPVIVRSSEGTYFLFFSAGCTSANSYIWDYVTSNSVVGPYSNRQTLLATGGFGEYGPGGADITPDGTTAVWHSLSVSDDISYPRVMNTGTITLSGTTASIN